MRRARRGKMMKSLMNKHNSMTTRSSRRSTAQSRRKATEVKATKKKQ